MIDKMSEEQLKACLLVVQDYLVDCGYSNLIMGPEHLREMLTEIKERIATEENAALYFVDAKLNNLKGPGAKSMKAKARKDWIKEDAIERLKDAKEEGHKMSWTEAKQLSDQRYVQMQKEGGIYCVSYSVRSLASIKRPEE